MNHNDNSNNGNDNNNNNNENHNNNLTSLVLLNNLFTSFLNLQKVMLLFTVCDNSFRTKKNIYERLVCFMLFFQKGTLSLAKVFLELILPCEPCTSTLLI